MKTWKYNINYESECYNFLEFKLSVNHGFLF